MHLFNMRQGRLSHFFSRPKSSSKPSPFLTLPPHVRQQVYRSLEIGEEWLSIHVHLNTQELKPVENLLFPKPTWYCETSYQLLFVCRTIYQEVCPLVYATYYFMLSYHGAGGFTPLYNLSQLAFSSIRHLTISLHVLRTLCQTSESGCGCFEACMTCESIDLLSERKALGRTSRSDQTLLKEWRQLCTYLAQNLEPHRLRLCLVCDVDGEETALQIIEPMRRLPRLAACSVRLSASPRSDPNLCRLAIDTATALTYGALKSSNPVALPVEVQVKILEQTDLVAPSKLTWLPPQRYDVTNHSKGGSQGAWALPPYTSCELCLPLHDHNNVSTVLPTAAYSTCSCWRFPTKLFQLSRPLHWEAKRIFYSRNEFIIEGGIEAGHLWMPTSLCPIFTPPLQNDAIPWLRSLQLSVPTIHGQPPLLSRFDGSLWLSLLEMLHQHAKLTQLTLTIDFSSSCGASYTQYIQYMTAEDFSARQAERKIVSAITMLEGLKDFFVFEAPKDQYDPEGSEQIRREATLEQLVMGQQYDSLARGKPSVTQRKKDPHSN